MPAASEAPYLRIAGEIAHRIRSGRLKVGDRVPSSRQITREWGVAIATATKALAELRARGLVRAVPGVGTVVLPAVEDADRASVAADRMSNNPSSNVGPSHAGPSVPAGQTTRPSRGGTSRPGVSGARAQTANAMRDQIVRVAVDVADAEGFEAVSMRRIAVELGVPTMSLYRYVPSKDELAVLVIDAAIDMGPWPKPENGWRAQLEYVARRHWAACRKHPWLARLISLTRPQLAPKAMALTEWTMRALDSVGLDAMTRMQVAIAMAGQVQGIAVSLESETQAMRDTGIDNEQWMQAQVARLETVLASGQFPMIASLSSEPDADFTLDATFEFGLALTLDGLAAFIEQSQSRRRGTVSSAGRRTRPPKA
jgi:AcrR family transcriptional regulator/DNA-binding transcriptional regulator YhcF (GntR family)